MRSSSVPPRPVLMTNAGLLLRIHVTASETILVRGTSAPETHAGRYAFMSIAVMAIGAQVSGGLNGSVGIPRLYQLSLVLLGLAALLVALGRGGRGWPIRAALFLYLGSASALILSQAGRHSELTLLLLIPVVGMATTGTAAQSALMLALMTGAVAGIADYHHDSGMGAVRSNLLWAGTGLIASMSSQGIRRRLATAEAQLAVLARTDPLTGIANRRGFLEGVAERRGRRGFALVFLDLDGFKHVNDTEGHSAGDELLRRAAGSLWGAVRAGDIVARLGGDEFVVFLADAGRAEAEVTAGRLEAAIAALGQGNDPVRASVGLAVGEAGSNLDEVLAAADQAMYENKRNAKAARAHSKEVAGGAQLRLSPIG